MKTILFLQLAGIAHLGLLCAGAAMPAVVKMREHLATLPPFIRQLFWTYYCFIGVCLVAFGSFTFFYAEKIAAGDSLARALCLFLAAFWTIRLLAAVFVFRMGPYLTSRLHRFGYAMLNAVFVCLIAVYISAACN